MRQLVEGERIRVVVTGMGAISPLGNNVEESWQKLIAGESGIDRISHDEGGRRIGAVNSVVDIAGLVKGFEPLKYISPKDLRRIHPSRVWI